ncbi:tyrosine-type recombinase/integrase [Novosphingobium aerophilum]|uniref:Site-specific integrase n=1 Tax=Novosphingobium aerophilum TaxID=2839843 RepID=A0A7X1FAM0_9SPHN|nr:site-specific integrase [Novosphingobium aerophilum]MBC2653475.1 site-specific integrase [Novosphingobium aerophilum]
MGVKSQSSLTKRTVDAAHSTGKRYHIWDCDLRGFGLRIEPSGIKTFIAKYRVGGGGRNAPQRIQTIGRYGTLTPEEARRKAKAVLGSVAAGADPQGDLSARRREMTMAALIDFYETHGCVVQRGKRIGEPMKPLTKAYTLARLRHHVIPLLGNRRAKDVTSGDIERFAADVAAGKTAKNEKVGPRKRIIVKGGPGASRKVVRDLSAVFSFAKRSEIVERNPVENAAVRKTDGQKTRFLTLEEVSRLGSALDELERDGTNIKAINIARLWALTGCRRNEIAGLKWDEVDFENGMLVLEDSKTGQSMRPLGAAALTLLKQIERTEDSEFVFPADSGEGHFQGTKTPWARAIRKAELPGVTPHTLRHTIGSTAISTGEAMALTGAILGHSNPRSTAIYAHIQHEPSRKAANRVSKKIAAALLPNAVPTGPLTIEDQKLLQAVKARLAKADTSARKLRDAIVALLDQQASKVGCIRCD